MAKKKNSQKLKIFSGIAFIFVFFGLMIFLFSGDNFVLLKEIFQDDITKDELQDTLGRLGYKGYLTFGILSMLQVVLTILPAEPVQVMCGISFGFLRGSLICLVGVFVGNTIIYILYKVYGQRLEEFFEKNAEFDFETARRSNKVALVVFILYFLPAIPYGLICFFAASLDGRYPKYILLTTLGALPSIWIGVGLGHIAIASSWVLSIVIFLVLVALLMMLYKHKAEVFAKVNRFMKEKSQPYSSKTVAKKYNPFLYRLMSVVVGGWYARKIKIRLENKAGTIEKPSLVICNHGSFIDFLYAGELIKKSNPHFITARMYFYHKRLGNFIRRLGCLPKSMFTTDLENAKNCMRVLKDGGVLAMMPEARLSTVGRYEGIHDTTYRFIQRAGVPVYAIRLNGDYFAKPKWGKGVRGGARVEGRLERLFTREDLQTLSLEELRARVDNALDYNEFEWLETQPKIRYKSKRMAEGLENILCRCPECNSRYSLRTEGKSISCEKCNFTRYMDSRYAFTQPVPFENFAKWYDWQTAELAKEIENDPDFALEEEVVLKHSSKDGKTMLREAGKGVCSLDRTGLTYRGTEDGLEVEKVFPMAEIYRILFGAGENFELYEGNEIWFFAPEDGRCCVEWYIASGLLKERYGAEN